MGIVAIIFSLVIGGAGVQAQQPARLPLIGVLFPASPTSEVSDRRADYD